MPNATALGVSQPDCFGRREMRRDQSNTVVSAEGRLASSLGGGAWLLLIKPVLRRTCDGSQRQSVVYVLPAL